MAFVFVSYDLKITDDIKAASYLNLRTAVGSKNRKMLLLTQICCGSRQSLAWITYSDM